MISAYDQMTTKGSNHYSNAGCLGVTEGLREHCLLGRHKLTGSFAVRHISTRLVRRRRSANLLKSAAAIVWNLEGVRGAKIMAVWPAFLRSGDPSAARDDTLELPPHLHTFLTVAIA